MEVPFSYRLGSKLLPYPLCCIIDGADRSLLPMRIMRMNRNDMMAEIDSLRQESGLSSSPEDTDKWDTQRFAHYDLVRRIAVGGMGEVYLAHQRTAFGREVAVKIIRSDLVHDMTARKRFL